MDLQHLIAARNKAKNRIALLPLWQRNELLYQEQRLAEREQFWQKLRIQSAGKQQ